MTHKLCFYIVCMETDCYQTVIRWWGKISFSVLCPSKSVSCCYHFIAVFTFFRLPDITSTLETDQVTS